MRIRTIALALSLAFGGFVTHYLCAVRGLRLAARAAGTSYQVLGVIASSADGQGVALLKAGASGEAFAVRVGDALDPDTSVARIAHDFVYFTTKGRDLAVRIGDSTTDDVGNRLAGPASGAGTAALGPITAGLERNGDTVVMTAALRDDLTKTNLATVLNQAAALPYFVNGQLSGFQLQSIDAGSIYEKVGFVNGDIITALNGQQLTDVARTIRMLQDMKDAGGADIQFTRNGIEQRVKLQVN